MVRISIEGNIASGKSTLCRICETPEVVERYFANHRPVRTLQENVQWFTETGLLTAYENDMEKYGFVFQIGARTERYVSQLIDVQTYQTTSGLTIQDRSVYGDKNTFAQNLHNTGKINDIEWRQYLRDFDFHEKLFKHIGIKQDGFIFLNTSPELCYHRMINVRRRDAEKNLPINYLHQLQALHIDWLGNENGKTVDGIPVLQLNGNFDFEHDPVALHHTLSTISDWVNGL